MTSLFNQFFLQNSIDQYMYFIQNEALRELLKRKKESRKHVPVKIDPTFGGVSLPKEAKRKSQKLYLFKQVGRTYVTTTF